VCGGVAFRWEHIASLALSCCYKAYHIWEAQQNECGHCYIFVYFSAGRCAGAAAFLA